MIVITGFLQILHRHAHQVSGDIGFSANPVLQLLYQYSMFLKTAFILNSHIALNPNLSYAEKCINAALLIKCEDYGKGVTPCVYPERYESALEI